MKISAKLQQPKQQQQPEPPALHLRAKIPVTIFNLPFLSHISTTVAAAAAQPSSPDLSLSLSTNFPSFPSLKLSYSSSSSAVAAAVPPSNPLTLTLKSGTGLFGSPNDSPLVISARFSFTSNPTFCLLFKPRLGSFSLRKSTVSHPTTNGCDSNPFGFVPVETPTANVKELVSVESDDDIDRRDDSILKGIQLAARTHLPVAKRVALSCRWWVGFAEDQMPVLRINKIGIQRVHDVSMDDEKKKKKKSEGEVEALKGMCVWMKKELECLTRANREMKCELEEMKANGGDFRERLIVGNKGAKMPSVVESHSSGGFEQWRSKRKNNGGGGGGENGKKEEMSKSGTTSANNSSLAFDVENELQRAIKEAAAASPS